MGVQRLVFSPLHSLDSPPLPLLRPSAGVFRLLKIPRQPRHHDRFGILGLSPHSFRPIHLLPFDFIPIFLVSSSTPLLLRLDLDRDFMDRRSRAVSRRILASTSPGVHLAKHRYTFSQMGHRRSQRLVDVAEGSFMGHLQSLVLLQCHKFVVIFSKRMEDRDVVSILPDGHRGASLLVFRLRRCRFVLLSLSVDSLLAADLQGVFETEGAKERRKKKADQREVGSDEGKAES